MTWQAAVAVLCAAGSVAGGALLVGLLAGWVRLDGSHGAALRARAGAVLNLRVLVAVLMGLVVLVVTGWVAIAVGVAAAIVLWPRLFGGAAEQQAHIERLEALAMWVEALRDTLDGGRMLPEVIVATAGPAPALLRRPLQDLVARMQAREPLRRALLTFADDLADPVADQVLATLALNADTSSKRLPTVLGSLAASTRRQVDVRRQVEAQRRAPRRGVKIVIVVTVLLVVGFAVGSPDYLAPFSTLVGQLVLAGAVGCFAGGFIVLRALATFQAPDRFLATPGVNRAAAQAAQTVPTTGTSSMARTVLGSVAVKA